MNFSTISKSFLTATAIAAVFSASVAFAAETAPMPNVAAGDEGIIRTEVRTEVREIIKLPPETRLVNFKELDLDGDNNLTKQEVGEKLFKLYDTDGNQVIDNIEYERKAVITIQPVERETTTEYFVNGKPDKVETDREDFMRETMLSQFDKNKDGLSPRVFLERDFKVVDVNKDKGVTLREWLGAYIEKIDRRNRANAGYNR